MFHANDILVGTLSARLLVRTRPFDSIFTGTHLALHAQGADYQGSLNWAYFSDCSWSGIKEGGK